MPLRYNLPPVNMFDCNFFAKKLQDVCNSRIIYVHASTTFTVYILNRRLTQYNLM